MFLKIPYFGPAAMEALATYDPLLVVGMLGGSAGTTFDAFHMLWEAKKYGARVALYGRKINNAEHQLTFVRYLRAIADDQILPEEAVRAYHGDLQRLKIRPQRSLEDDLSLTPTAHSYGGTPPAPATPAAAGEAPKAATPHGLRQQRGTRLQQDDFGRKSRVESGAVAAEFWGAERSRQKQKDSAMLKTWLNGTLLGCCVTLLLSVDSGSRLGGRSGVRSTGRVPFL